MFSPLQEKTRTFAQGSQAAEMLSAQSNIP
jgi:hypothetical protein